MLKNTQPYRRREFHTFWKYFVCLATIAGVGSVFSFVTLRSPDETIEAPSFTRNVTPAGLRTAVGRVYPYSVIPGGVHTPEELPLRLAADPVAAAHYRGFQAENVRFFRASASQLYYVSYRIKDNIYWTKKQLTVPAGELLYTDGKEVCRARCGNRLSVVLRRPFTPLEPVEPVFDEPTAVPPPELTAELTGPTFRPFDFPAVSAPRIPPAVVVVTPTPLTNRVSACCEFGTNMPRHRFSSLPLATPEPSYSLFSFLAVAALGAKLLWDRRRVRAVSSARAASDVQTPRP
ncbi:MAG TPA: hypothetical protein DEQ47_14195 [Solibacterales bacterium]|nr:hypothetical protein [Bryobacterales bacterium]